jgi:purine-binding chemotaxis protein CheW
MEKTLSIEDLDLNRYLIFRLGEELYGSPLHSVREVLKLPTIKSVPYMKNHFKGVINLRGAIVSIIDLRQKFDIKAQLPGLILTVESDGDTIGAIVDDVSTVTTIPEAEIERNVRVETKVPLQFFHGVAKVQGRLVNIIDIAGTLSSEELATIKRNLEQTRGAA